MNKIEKLKKTEEFYDDWIEYWQDFARWQIKDLDLEILALEEFQTYPDPVRISEIYLNGWLAKKRITSLKRAKSRAIRYIIEDREIEGFIDQVF